MGGVLFLGILGFVLNIFVDDFALFQYFVVSYLAFIYIAVSEKT